MNLCELKIPDMGGVDNAKVAEIYIKVGDTIKKDDNIIMLETDKATMEVPASEEGIVEEILLKVGSVIKENDIIAKIKLAPKSNENNNSKVEANKVPSSQIENSNQIKCEVLVIGAGPGGYTAAFRAADLGKKVVLIEKHATLGGVCLNVGCIPSKALLHVAKVINEAEELEECGVEFNSPKINLDKIRAYKSKVVGRLTQGLNTLADKRKVKVVRGMAQFSSNNEVEVETLEGIVKVHFDSAIIAAGSESFKVPHFPFEDPRIMDSTRALELQDIPGSMLIVGGGIIGLEMAEFYSTFGSKITIVELGDRLIPGADSDLVKVLETRIKKRYTIYTKTRCTQVEAKKDAIYVNLEDQNGKEQTLKFDKILVAAGRIPNGKKLGLDKAGVNVDERGFVPVDKACRTNIPNIYAIGDIVGQPMLAHKATHEGKVAAENCSGMKSFFDARAIPSVAYTDPEIAWMGVSELEAKEKGLEIEVAKFPWAALGRALGSNREDGFTKVIVDKKTHKIIGAGIVGINAGELIAEAVLALETNCDVHDLGLTIHPHPTLSESLALACEMSAGTITDLYISRK